MLYVYVCIVSPTLSLCSLFSNKGHVLAINLFQIDSHSVDCNMHAYTLASSRNNHYSSLSLQTTTLPFFVFGSSAPNKVSLLSAALSCSLSGGDGNGKLITRTIPNAFICNTSSSTGRCCISGTDHSANSSLKTAEEYNLPKIKKLKNYSLNYANLIKNKFIIMSSPFTN